MKRKPNWLLHGLIGGSLLAHGIVLMMYIPPVDKNRRLRATSIELSWCDTAPKAGVASRRPSAAIPAKQVEEVLSAGIAALAAPRHPVLKPITPRSRPAKIKAGRAEKKHWTQAAARSEPRRAGRLIEKTPPNSSRAVAVVRKTIEAGESAAKHCGEDNDKSRQEYLKLVRSRIVRHKKYPRRARIRWLQGEVTIRLCLTPTGETKNLAVSKSSGREILDQAALRAVRDAAPFPRPPEKIFKGEINLELTIIFKLT
ncbi:MAG TPA: energy transducer TonB [Desulfobacterales bacterium]|nr:energy transducer TonB [Desulfobacterales bacterium]